MGQITNTKIVTFNFPPSTKTSRDIEVRWGGGGEVLGMLFLRGFHFEYTNHRHFDAGLIEVDLQELGDFVSGRCHVQLRDDTEDTREWTGWVKAIAVFGMPQPQ
ncbi:hypothetical protein ACFV1L_30385 [Kitasatospora sp. NPDC059646]|uniref:hypothetical protein n=1 Tax=Kitasatospora sp. NPDC059646 TaxID=3346893 RepID=UPI0036CDEA15